MNEALTTDQIVWTKYEERRPEVAGPYLWQVPSVRVPGLTVEFVAHMRKRGAGYRDVLSPSFDHWDGYQVHVPVGTLWTATALVCKEHETRVGLTLPNIELKTCPFCRRVPTWHGTEQSRGGGVYIGSDPHQFNSWWLECCSWARTPHFDDPRELAKQRNEMLARVS